VSVTARAVSSTATMPVHFELIADVLFFVMCSAPQRLRAVMSPWEVVARMSSSVVPSFLRALLTRP
jgi:hypothetical protein